MSEDNLVSVCVMARKDQAALMTYLADRIGVSRGVLARWVFDDARAFMLEKAGLTEAQLPKELQKQEAHA